MVKELFKKALVKMLEEHEFEKMILAYKEETEIIENDRQVASVLAKNDIPIIPLLMSIQSAETFKDAITIMINMEEN